MAALKDNYMKYALATVLAFSAYLLLVCCSRPTGNVASPPDNVQKLVEHSHQLKTYAAAQKASTQYGILIDMSLNSSKKRFFVVNLQNDSVVISGLCCHGQCGNYWSEEVKFGNTPGCGCSSEGRYKVGVKYNGSFGTAYKLHGLDATNNKAFERFVVFHSHSCVYESEGIPICRSDGCPTVALAVLKQTEKILDKSEKPVLMWIYK
jgi:hypothetical protein